MTSSRRDMPAVRAVIAHSPGKGRLGRHKGHRGDSNEGKQDGGGDLHGKQRRVNRFVIVARRTNGKT
jgi:hypothetical protein